MKNATERTHQEKTLVASIYSLTDQIETTSNPTLGFFCQTAADDFEALPASTWGVENESLKARVFMLKSAARRMQD